MEWFVQVCALGNGLRNTLGTSAVTYSPLMGSAKCQLVAGTQGLVRTRKNEEKKKKKNSWHSGLERRDKARGVKVSTTSLMELPSRVWPVTTSPLLHAAAFAMLAEEEDASQMLTPSHWGNGGRQWGQWGCGMGF